MQDIPPPPLHQLLTLQQVADTLQVDDRTVRRLIQAGKLPGRRIGGQLRIKPDDLQHYIDRGAEPTVHTPPSPRERPTQVSSPSLTTSESPIRAIQQARSAPVGMVPQQPLGSTKAPLGLRTRSREARVIALAIQKGGTGKTTATFNLSAELRRKGYQVLAFDADPQSSLTRISGIATKGLEITNYDVLMNGQWVVIKDTVPSTIDLSKAELELVVNNPIWGLALKEALAPHRGEYDFILIDCPPTLGTLTINGLLAADGVIIPVQTEEEAYRGLELLVGSMRRIRPTLPIIAIQPTQYKSRSILHKQVLAALIKLYPDLVTSPIVDSIKYPESMSEHLPIADYYPELGKPWVDLAGVVERWAGYV